MTSHPNRGWRGRWTVDTAKNEARHGPSGLVVRFEKGSERRFGEVAEAGIWNGHAVNAQDVFLALKAAGTQGLERVLARLMREAGDIFSERRDAE